MVVKFIKIMALIIIGSSFINSCQNDDTSDTFQVYNEDGTLYKGHSDLIGIPLIPISIFDLPWNPDDILDPERQRLI